MTAQQLVTKSALSLSALADSMRDELTGNIIPFWLSMIDIEHGGFNSYSDVGGEHISGLEKGSLLNSRILWFFSRAARELKEFKLSGACYGAAVHAFEFLKDHLLDSEHGGLYWSVDVHGQPLDTQKHIYNQAFAVYALSEWYVTSKDESILPLIDSLHQLIELHARDHTNRGYIEAFDREWNSIENTLLCDTGEAVSPKSMNTHLHILEAYSRYYDIHPVPEVKAAIVELIFLLCGDIQNDRNSFFQFFSLDWQVQSYNHSFGHDIEGSWLVWEAAEKVLMDEELKYVQKSILDMVDSVSRYGLDFDGAVFNEWVNNRFTDTMRVWWVQAEAIVGFVNAWQITRDPKYLDAAKKPWLVLSNMLIDEKNGEWHWETDRWGSVNLKRPKVSLWKCPYHNGRACLEILKRSSEE